MYYSILSLRNINNLQFDREQNSLRKYYFHFLQLFVFNLLIVMRHDKLRLQCVHVANAPLIEELYCRCIIRIIFNLTTNKFRLENIIPTGRQIIQKSMKHGKKRLPCVHLVDAPLIDDPRKLNMIIYVNSKYEFT